jgi:hypothetical protein
MSGAMESQKDVFSAAIEMLMDVEYKYVMPITHDNSQEHKPYHIAVSNLACDLLRCVSNYRNPPLGVRDCEEEYVLIRIDIYNKLGDLLNDILKRYQCITDPKLLYIVAEVLIYMYTATPSLRRFNQLYDLLRHFEYHKLLSALLNKSIVYIVDSLHFNTARVDYNDTLKWLTNVLLSHNESKKDIDIMLYFTYSNHIDNGDIPLILTSYLIKDNKLSRKRLDKIIKYLTKYIKTYTKFYVPDMNQDHIANILIKSYIIMLKCRMHCKYKFMYDRDIALIKLENVILSDLLYDLISGKSNRAFKILKLYNMMTSLPPHCAKIKAIIEERFYAPTPHPGPGYALANDNFHSHVV